VGMLKPIWRLVAKYESHYNPGYGSHWAVGGSNKILLSCGHDIYRKLSQKIPKKARCRDCEKLRDGCKVIWGNPPNQVEEIWDHKTQMPKKVKLNGKTPSST
jgi:hypothetical protein